MIELTESQWHRLHQRLVQDHAHEPSVMLIRDKMRRVLGFTPRHHREWVTVMITAELSWRQPQDRVCLDFYDPGLEAWFRLRYCEYLQS